MNDEFFMIKIVRIFKRSTAFIDVEHKLRNYRKYKRISVSKKFFIYCQAKREIWIIKIDQIFNLNTN